jgi:hypothetical protein
MFAPLISIIHTPPLSVSKRSQWLSGDQAGLSAATQSLGAACCIGLQGVMVRRAPPSAGTMAMLRWPQVEGSCLLPASPLSDSFPLKQAIIVSSGETLGALASG